MATVRFKVNVGDPTAKVVQEAGAATNSHQMEFTVDMATTTINQQPGTTRALTKTEILEGLEKIKLKVIQSKTLSR